MWQSQVLQLIQGGAGQGLGGVIPGFSAAGAAPHIDNGEGPLHAMPGVTFFRPPSAVDAAHSAPQPHASQPAGQAPPSSSVDRQDADAGAPSSHPPPEMQWADDADVPLAVPGANVIMDEREVKRQKRKESNRESARRSRMKKQQETENLARTVQRHEAEIAQWRAHAQRLKDNLAKLAEQVRELGGEVDEALLDAPMPTMRPASSAEELSEGEPAAQEPRAAAARPAAPAAQQADASTRSASAPLQPISVQLVPCMSQHSAPADCAPSAAPAQPPAAELQPSAVDAGDVAGAQSNGLMGGGAAPQHSAPRGPSLWAEVSQNDVDGGDGGGPDECAAAGRRLAESDAAQPPKKGRARAGRRAFDVAFGNGVQG